MVQFVEVSWRGKRYPISEKCLVMRKKYGSYSLCLNDPVLDKHMRGMHIPLREIRSHVFYKSWRMTQDDLQNALDRRDVTMPIMTYQEDAGYYAEDVLDLSREIPPDFLRHNRYAACARMYARTHACMPHAHACIPMHTYVCPHARAGSSSAT